MYIFSKYHWLSIVNTFVENVKVLEGGVGNDVIIIDRVRMKDNVCHERKGYPYDEITMGY